MAETAHELARMRLSLVGEKRFNPESGYEIDLFMWKAVDGLCDLVYCAPFARLV